MGSAPDTRRLLAASDGFTLIELLAALLVLAVGILATFGVYNSSKHATSASEAQQTEIQRAQKELERLQSLPYKRLVLTKIPMTSTNVNNPGHYVSSPAGSCEAENAPVPTFTWNQSAGEQKADQLIVNGCYYEYEREPKKRVLERLALSKEEEATAVNPEARWEDGRLSGTVYDYVTWVTKDPNCNPGNGCPEINDYKRITVEVTNNSPIGASAPRAPVLVSAIVANPHEVPIGGNPNSGNPIDNPEVKCTNGLGQQVTCDYGLGNQTANTLYLTDSPEETGYKTPESSHCMHYTQALLPSSCEGTPNAEGCKVSTSTYTSCPQPDLLNVKNEEAMANEFIFSSNIPGSTAGRVIEPDSKASGSTPQEACAKTPSENAAVGEFWATQPLSSTVIAQKLTLSGKGGMTINTQTFKGIAASVTLCAGIYLENPVVDGTCKAVLGPKGKPILDPLNLLNSSTCSSTNKRSDSELLGVATFTMAQWPSVLSQLSFTFEYMSGAREAAEGTSIAVRLWLTAGSGEGIVIEYDGPSVASSVQINSQ